MDDLKKNKPIKTEAAGGSSGGTHKPPENPADKIIELGMKGHIIVNYGETTLVVVGVFEGIDVGSKGYSGKISIRDSNGKQIIRLNGTPGVAEVGGNGVWGQLIIKSIDNKVSTRFDGGSRVFVGGDGYDGQIYLRDQNGNDRVLLNTDSGVVQIGGNGVWGQLIIKSIDNKVSTRFDGGSRVFVGGDGYDGQIYVKDKNGNNQILLDATAGDITLLGADCAEEFEIVDVESIDPGTVLVIGKDGQLQPSQKPFDKRVAGVVSGSKEYRPGIILDRRLSDKKRMPIALTGKTYCKVDAQHSPIEIGDLLTTSSTKGHAMRADDPLRAFGAVIGKALSPCEEGLGRIPILVALQ